METTNNPEPKAPARNPGLVWNVLTLVMMVGVVILLALFALIFINPRVGINPFPPASLPSALKLPTATPTLKALPATWTLTPTIEPTLTNTPKPPTATATLYVIPGSATPTVPTATASPTVKANYPFAVRGAPVAIASTITRPDTSCNWTGVAGQVFDLQGAGMVGYTIQLGGGFSGKSIDQLSLSGTALQYGTAGFEFYFGDKPANTKQALWLQLLDQAGLPLSEKVYFDTYSDCSKNLILINFKQIK